MALSRITEAVASFTDLTIGDDLTLTDDLLMASDANIIKFGADADVTLTHVHNTGLLLNSTSVIQFNDASQNIGAPSATVLDINATDEIELNATLVDVNANLDVSGTIVSGGTLTATTSIGIGSAVLTEAELELLDGITAGTAAASKVLVLDSDKDIGTIRNLTIDGVFTDGNYTFDTSGNVSGLGTVASGAITSSGIIKTDNTTAATSTTDGSLQTDGGLSVAADAVIGDDLILLSDAAVLSFGANSEIALTHVHNTGLLLTDSGGSPTLQLHNSAESVSSDGSKLILTSNSVAFSLPTADGSSGQTLVTNGSGVLSFATASANTPSSADGQALGSASLEWSDLFLADGGTVTFGNDQDIILTHVADVGLTLTNTTSNDNKPIVLQLKSEEDEVIANEVIASIEFAAGDSDGSDGATIAAGIHAIAEGTFSASANATKLVFTTGIQETAAASATAKMTLSSAGLLTIADDLMIKDGGTIGVASTNDAITISSAGIVTFKDDILIKNGGTIGSASDADAITIASNGQLTLTQTLIGTALDISGDMDIDGTSNMDAIDVDGAANFAADVTIATGADLITATAGTSNTRVGVNAGDAIQSGGNYNVVIGDEAGTAITTGDENIFIGYASGDATTTASDNTGVGHEALTTNILGSRSVAIGANSLLTQNPASAANMYNTAVGYDSGRAITTGTLNTVVGGFAGDALTTGSSNTAIGYEALTSSEDGGGNNALGYRAGVAITSGARNIAIGEQGMYGLTTANDCIGMGQQSFYATCTGSANIGLGYRSFFSCTSGHSNVAMGYQTLADLTSADQSVAIGYRALPHVSVSDSNIGIGAKAGDGIRGTALVNGTANILIGKETDTAAADNDFSIVMGVNAVGKGSNTGFISPNDGAVYQGNNSSSWSTTSDRRIKKNIVDNTVGLDAINQVQVKNFEYRTEDEITEVPSHAAINKQGVQIGVIAQEIQTTLPDMVNEESTGVLSVNPDNMTWYLVNAVQELSAKNDALEARISELEGN